MSDHSTPVTEDIVPPELRQSYKANGLVPLWESVPGSVFGKQIEETQIWRWSTMLPIIQETAKMRAAHVLDRRVLLMTNLKRLHVWDEAGTGTLMFDFQCVMPGERAAAHRHSMNALRFVVQCTGGVKSIVDGKDCAMEPGDLILTPGWCWHEHTNEGKDPIIWLDVLDVMLHHFLGTTGFQPGPARDLPAQLSDSAFVHAGIVPKLQGGDHASRGYSPIFRYPWVEAVEALAASPATPDGSREVRYTNPLTGGPAMDLIDASLLQLEPGKATRKYKSSAAAMCIVVEGHGVSQIGDKSIEWSPHDVFTMPANLWASHQAEGGTARIFQVSSREVYRRLGLFTEAFGE